MSAVTLRRTLNHFPAQRPHNALSSKIQRVQPSAVRTQTVLRKSPLKPGIVCSTTGPIPTQETVKAETAKAGTPNKFELQSSVPASFYKSISAVVAGATEFLGYFIVQRLADQGASVKALVEDTSDEVATILSFMPNVEVIESNIRQDDSLKGVFSKSNTLIIAMGKRPLFFANDKIEQSNLRGWNPSEDPDIVQGTVNLVREAQSSGIQRIVLLSTLPTDDPPLSNQPEEFNIMSVFSPDRLMQGLMYAVDQLNKGWPMTDRYAASTENDENINMVEKYVSGSGIDFTIIRPGSLWDQPPSTLSNSVDVLFQKPGTSRLSKEEPLKSWALVKQIAQIAVDSVLLDAAKNKTVEIMTMVPDGTLMTEMQSMSISEKFSAVR